MRQFYLCEDPNEGLPEGISAYIYHYSAPRFFGVIKRLGLGIPTQNIAYEGITVMFYYQAPGEQDAEYYLLYGSDNIDGVEHFYFFGINFLEFAAGDEGVNDGSILRSGMGTSEHKAFLL